jgi:hypothetical protein
MAWTKGNCNDAKAHIQIPIIAKIQNEAGSACSDEPAIDDSRLINIPEFSAAQIVADALKKGS